MNPSRRLSRRDMTFRGIPVRTATEVCEGCGAPICPKCNLECGECECCGEFSCDLCGAYVLRPAEELYRLLGALPPGVAGGRAPEADSDRPTGENGRMRI